MTRRTGERTDGHRGGPRRPGGVQLFRKLGTEPNGGDAVGISYHGFVAHVYGVPFAALQGGRRWLPSDTSNAVQCSSSALNARLVQSLGGL